MELQLTTDGLKFIAENNYEKLIKLAKYNAYCPSCYRYRCVEMVNFEIYLNNVNDVIFKGTCKTCKRKINRYVETGEHDKFYLKSQILKNAHNN